MRIKLVRNLNIPKKWDFVLHKCIRRTSKLYIKISSLAERMCSVILPRPNHWGTAQGWEERESEHFDLTFSCFKHFSSFLNFWFSKKKFSQETATRASKSPRRRTTSAKRRSTERSTVGSDADQRKPSESWLQKRIETERCTVKQIWKWLFWFLMLITCARLLSLRGLFGRMCS